MESVTDSDETTWKTKIPDDTKKFPHKSSHV